MSWECPHLDDCPQCRRDFILLMGNLLKFVDGNLDAYKQLGLQTPAIKQMEEKTDQLAKAIQDQLERFS